MNSNNFNEDTKDSFLNKNIKIQNDYPITNEDTKKQENEWKIIIPKIYLEAEISEGTEAEVMNDFVGHFKETSRTIGNVGLAAHNRGYKVNYFSDLKKLKEGDEIIYKYKNFQKTYIVKKHEIIKDDDWDNLINTKENKITLITCVENEKDYRRCIQGIEKVE